MDILAALTFPNTVRLVMEEGDKLAGFIIGNRRHMRSQGWIASIGVHPDHRRKGFGTRLLLACERELDMEHIRLSLRVSNQAALRLYKQHGYHQVDCWPRYYRNGEDAVVMEKVGMDESLPTNS